MAVGVKRIRNATKLTKTAKIIDGIGDSASDAYKAEKKSGGINVDRDKKLTIRRYFNRVDTNATYEDIKALRKVNAKVRDVVLRLENDNDGGDRWLELSLDNKTIVDLDKLESTIDTLKSSFMEESKTNVAFEYNVIEFDKGENFLEWIDEKKLSLSEFKESEIVQ